MGIFDWIQGPWTPEANGRKPRRAARIPGRFPLRLQRDEYSCAARSTQMVLTYYGRAMGYRSIKRALGTDEDGTAMAPVARLLRKRGLSVSIYPRMRVRDLERGLARGVVIVQVDGDHVAVVHDIDDAHVYIADPSPVRCAAQRQTRARFRARWDRWGMLVTDRKHGRPTPPLRVPIEVECPIGSALVDVPSADDTYACPHCDEEIEVVSREATHAELDVFVCPATARRGWVPHEETGPSEYWTCPECGNAVLVRSLDDEVHVLHGLEYV